MSSRGTVLEPTAPGTPAGAPPLARRALSIALSYAAFAGAWIYLSDRALAFLVPDPERFAAWSVWKGLAFVTVTSGLLLLLVRRAFRATERAWREREEEEARRRVHQAEAERVGRLYAALSHVNQAIVRTGDRDRLLQQVCSALVRAGGFRTAWVAWHDPESDRLVPVAREGEDGEYIGEVLIYADDRPEGQGPSGIAFRSGEPYFCRDVLADPNVELWRAAARQSGFRAAASLPIRVGGAVQGVLNVYAAEPDPFGPAEVGLLTEVADDLGFGIESLERDGARQRAEDRAEAERRFSETMTESMPGVLYMYDTRGRFLRWNHNLEEVTGYSAEELAGMHPLELFAPEDRSGVEERIREVFRTGVSTVEAPFLSRDGRKTPYFFTGRLVSFGGEDCLVGVGIDVSERHAAQEALRLLNESLEEAVEERTRELQEALVRAEAADRAKSAFLAAMSHELRTPLNSIIGFTGIVLQGLAGPLTEEQSRQLGMVRSSARHLLDLISDLLDLSKIEAEQLEVRREELDVGEMVDHVAATVRPLADARGLELRVEVPSDVGTVVGDRRRVQQVLLNLVNNGIKFTEKGSITVTAERQGGRVRLRVLDTGIGIRQEDLGRLFQPFSQLDTGLGRQHEGTGLGLAICRRLARLMGGDVVARSEWGQGSEFCVILPAGRQEAA